MIRLTRESSMRTSSFSYWPSRLCQRFTLVWKVWKWDSSHGQQGSEGLQQPLGGAGEQGSGNPSPWVQH